MPKINPPSSAFAWPTIDLDPRKISEFTAKMAGASYKLGAKAPKLTAQLGGIDRIDCSGYTRIILYKAGGVTIPDGSASQLTWFREQGFKRSDPQSAKLKDGALRVAVLPQQPGPGVGRHVTFILDGQTFESSPKTKGPGSRKWTATGWQSKCVVFVLTPPTR